MIKACVIGLGQRGHMLTRDVLLKIDKLEIVSVCDVYEDRIERTLETLKNANLSSSDLDQVREFLTRQRVMPPGVTLAHVDLKADVYPDMPGAVPQPQDVLLDRRQG